MRVAIWGAGGIGCYYGARLQRAGHDVVFIARGAHLQALQENGLTVKHETLSFCEPVEAVDQAYWLSNYECRDFDLIIIALKANATADVVSVAKEWLQRGDTPVLSLQNGVENETIIASAIGEKRTLGGLAVRIGGHIEAPGMVEARGVAQVVFGAWPVQSNAENVGPLETLARALREADIENVLSDNIQKELWRKLLINNGVNPLSAMTGLDTRALTSHPVHGQVVYRMMEDAAAAAQVEGVDITQKDVDEMFKLISEFDAIKTSMLVDREKGRPLELDGITGAVLRRFPDDTRSVLMTGFISELLRQTYTCD